jgi:hypothetical protein
LGGEVKGGRCYHSIFSRRRDAEIQFDIFLKKHFTTKFTDVNTAERQMESESDTVEKLNRFYLWTVSKINLHFKIIQRHGGVVLNTVIFGQRF